MVIVEAGLMVVGVITAIIVLFLVATKLVFKPLINWVIRD